VQNIEEFHILDYTPIKSDHAALSVVLYRSEVPLSCISACASLLGSYGYTNKQRSKKSLKYGSINPQLFLEKLNNTDMLWQSTDIIQATSESIYTACVESQLRIANTPRQGIPYHDSKWHALLQEKDSKKLWQAIGWKGTFDLPANAHSRPTDAQFATHFSALLNPENQQEDLVIPSSGIYIPVLDDDISPGEIIDQLKKLKPNKAAGVNGVPPGVLKWMPDEWIILITYIMNIVFSGFYPAAWCLSKMFVIFKKGLLSDTNNYRGISVTDALPKLYDGILNQRFSMWYKPCPEQAGAQAGRGCEEQLLALKLYIDVARKKKHILYVLFIDYVKAYDNVNRNKLLQMLCDFGCGDKFTSAIGNSLKGNIGVIGDTEFNYTSGVKQGSAISCNLFAFYLDHTVRAVRTFGPDDFLQNNHMILLMDDTALLATSRVAMARKLQLLYNSAYEINMVIHPEKSKYFAVNTNDTEPFTIGNVKIERTESYVYLGTPVSVNSIAKQVEDHIKYKYAHICKYYSFVHRNVNAPYTVKLRVFQAAVSSALLYSCESWLTNNLKCVDTKMDGCLRALLGVRNQTSRDLMYLETGVVPASSEVETRQINFFKKMKNRADFNVCPLGQSMQLAQTERSPMGIFMSKLDTNKTITKEQSLNVVKQRVTASTKTRMETYKQLNKELELHPIYNMTDICEFERINFSRLRLSSHYLRIETGRWGRIPREDRKCICGSTQTEEHVLLHCPETSALRRLHETLDYTSLQTLMNSEYIRSLVQFCSKVLCKMNKNY
jgi:hypothetical protein